MSETRWFFISTTLNTAQISNSQPLMCASGSIYYQVGSQWILNMTFFVCITHYFLSPAFLVLWKLTLKKRYTCTSWPNLYTQIVYGARLYCDKKLAWKWTYTIQSYIISCPAIPGLYLEKILICHEWSIKYWIYYFALFCTQVSFTKFHFRIVFVLSE